MVEFFCNHIFGHEEETAALSQVNCISNLVVFKQSFFLGGWGDNVELNYALLTEKR